MLLEKKIILIPVKRHYNKGEKGDADVLRRFEEEKKYGAHIAGVNDRLRRKHAVRQAETHRKRRKIF